MKTILRNILAVMAGAVIGSIVNGVIIMMSGYIIPPPEGADLKTMEGLTAAMPLMQPRHFILPFLAHALGTFVGAWIAVLIAVSRKMMIALGIGVLFLFGGIATIMDLPPSPVWFVVLDIVGAYLPMGYLGWKLAMRGKTNQ